MNIKITRTDTIEIEIVDNKYVLTKEQAILLRDQLDKVLKVDETIKYVPYTPPNTSYPNYPVITYYYYPFSDPNTKLSIWYGYK